MTGTWKVTLTEFPFILVEARRVQVICQLWSVNLTYVGIDWIRPGFAPWDWIS